MALAFVGGSFTAATASVSSYTVSLTNLTGGLASAPAAGDLVLIFTGWTQGGNGDPGITTPTDYTEIAGLWANDTRDANLSVNYKRMSTTPDTQITVSALLDPGLPSGTLVHVWRGVDETTPLDVTATTATGINGGIVDSPSITPITSGAVVITSGLATDSSGAASAPTAPSGYSNSHANYARYTTTRTHIMAASKAWTSGAEDPAAWGGLSGIGTSDSWAAITVVLRPGAGAAATSLPLIRPARKFAHMMVR